MNKEEETQKLYNALYELIDSKYIQDWVKIPNDALGGLKPIEIIDSGDLKPLWEMIFRLRSGMPG